MSKSRSRKTRARQPAPPPRQSAWPPDGWDVVFVFAIAAAVIAVTIVITRDADQVMRIVAALAAILVLLGIGRSARH